MPQEVIDSVNKLVEVDRKPSILTVYDRHGNPVGNTKNTNADLADVPEENTKEDDPVTDITGVDQDLPDNKHQYQETPTTIKTNMTSTTEPKKSETRLKMHLRAMIIHSPRIKNLNSY